MRLPSADFESAASASSAIPAWESYVVAVIELNSSLQLEFYLVSNELSCALCPNCDL